MYSTNTPTSVILHSEGDDSGNTWVGRILRITTNADSADRAVEEEDIQIQVRWYWSPEDVWQECLKRNKCLYVIISIRLCHGTEVNGRELSRYSVSERFVGTAVNDYAFEMAYSFRGDILFFVSAV